VKPPWTINIHFNKEEEQGGKEVFCGAGSVTGGGHKERGHEDEYGRCILHAYMKIEE
jgi:hypothetical protein